MAIPRSRRLGAVIRSVAGAVLLGLMTSGCLISERPLFGEAEAVTPLPEAFRLVQVNDDGTSRLDRDGRTNVSTVQRRGRAYQVDGLVATFFQPFVDRGLYLVQVTRPPGPEGPPLTQYAAARIANRRLEVFAFGVTDTLIGNMPRLRGRVTRDNGMWLFTNREDVIDAAREAIRAGRLQSQTTSQIATTQAELDAILARRR